jgi:lipoprotein-anchoring transpeptidase ErfK/SrfK
MIRFSRRNSLPRSASIKRLLFDPALAAGLALLLASAAPAAADFFGMPEQPPIEDADAGPPPAAKTYRSTSHRKTSHRAAKRHDSEAKQALAQGPFQIVVAIARQQVTLYGQNGAIARAAISTGVPEHPTPLGVFAVISKHKWHESNIYSGAPMPYMQRITWSGIALHAGPLPGYPASHGCIRLPQDFAIRLWGTTKVGARVIVTRESAAPVEIAHRNLFVPKKPEQKALAVAAAAEATKAAMILAADPPAAARLAVAMAMPAVSASIAVTPVEQRPVAEPPRRKGPVSVFVSRKQNRLFVRQGFEPLFDLPLTIAAPDRPLGTHVFTAMALQDDGAAMRWTVVSIPSGYPHPTDHAGKRAKKTSHDRRATPVAVAAPQTASTAAEALDRITLPAEAIEQISGLLSPGTSLIVSDNALSDETGDDTDFVVLTR